MDAKKVYRVLSVIFLILTVFFFVLFKNEQNVRNEISDEFVFNAVENFKNSGIQISDDIIERTIPEKDIYYFEIDSLDSHYEVITKALGESVFSSDVTTAEFETPDGLSVGIYGNNSQIEIGRIVFTESDFSFKLSKNGVNINGTDIPISNGEMSIISEKDKQRVEQICDSLTFGSKVGYRLSGCSGEEDFFVVTAVQTIDGFDCSDMFINFVFDNNELISVSGKWVVETPKAKYNNTLADGINILYSLNLNTVSEITSERIVYILKNPDVGRYFFVPVWEIAYTDKNGVNETVFLDAI